MTGGAPPPPPSSGGGGGRGALLDQIRQGNPVLKPPGEKPVGGGGGGGGGGRGALLDQIRQGSALKKVTSCETDSMPSTPVKEEEGLAGALARALQKRENAIQSDSDSDFNGEDDSDDDWSD
uniref:Neural Wiskott-Aldrich syndrome protein-like n=1 Tax=Phallusia mammillata TaxID=59560 RepID=A0A6F9DXD8_9ASCI|nr:neural Wiskott-Aldrich syndrome protein-like [Phallusia mammillata]